MLVLSRKRDSEIRIGTGIVVKVLSVRHLQVKLGIEAPNNVHIWRGEIAPTVQRSKRSPPCSKACASRNTCSASLQDRNATNCISAIGR